MERCRKASDGMRQSTDRFTASDVTALMNSADRRRILREHDRITSLTCSLEKCHHCECPFRIDSDSYGCDLRKVRCDLHNSQNARTGQVIGCRESSVIVVQKVAESLRVETTETQSDLRQYEQELLQGELSTLYTQGGYGLPTLMS